MKTRLVVVFGLLVLLFTGLLIGGCSEAQSPHYFKRTLSDNWLVQSADSVTADGSAISVAGFNGNNWYRATVPSTVLHALVSNGVYKNIFLDDNLNKISDKPFKSSWWYRTSFTLDKVPEVLLLGFDGVNYKANVWLNGKQIAGKNSLINAFRQFKFDISKLVHKGNNVLAVEVFPPVPGDFTIGFVDWNPAPPDNNMGLFREVYLEGNGGTGLDKPFMVTTLTDDLTTARLTASVEVTNYNPVVQYGEIVLNVDGKKIIKVIELKPGENRKVIFSPDDFDELVIKNPKLWWPHTLGEPHLYHASFEFLESGKKIDKKEFDFGIRTVSDYFNRDGSRGFKINGQKILIRGGGWVDRLLLDDTPESVKNQLEYVKDMNLNTIRLEGFWGNDQTIYNLCDRMGILIMAGWSCHWEWEDYLGAPCSEEYGGILKPEDMEMMSLAWQDQVIWLRNHPSVFTWLAGSDCVPRPELEQKYFNTFNEYDSTRVYLASAKEWDISLAGPTGVKMRGPYAYVPPVYWFADTLYGGAFGFNTETGPGAQVPPLESIKKMISRKHLWPVDSVWDYHCGRHEFNDLSRYTTALEKRYGKAVSVEDYTRKAQLLNYELMRPMFEAFSAYRYRATGVIQWMLNSAWPEMYWQLYDYYLMPNGAYYGAKKASQPFHVIYDPSDHSVYVVNDRLENKTGCTVKIKAYDIHSTLKYEKKIKTDLAANAAKRLIKLPGFSWNKNVCFLDLRLADHNGKTIDINFYWLSAKKDIPDYEATLSSWYYHTPSKQYADFTAVNNMPKVKVTSSFKQKAGQNNKSLFEVELTNNSNKIAFFINVKIVDEKTGNTIVPVLWSDNYVSLLPGETRVLTAAINKKDLKNITPKLMVRGYNE